MPLSEKCYQIVCRSFAGRFLDVSWTFLGRFPDVNVPEMSLTRHGNVRETILNYFAGMILAFSARKQPKADRIPGARIPPRTHESIVIESKNKNKENVANNDQNCQRMTHEVSKVN